SGQQVLFDDTDDNSQPFSLQETGTYQLIVDGNGDTTGDYSFRLLDLASVTDLTFDTTIEGTLEPGTETDLFKFTGTTGQKLFLEDNGSQSGGSVILYGPGNQFITSVSLSGNREITLPGDGEYILAIEGFSGEQTLNYSFQVVTPETITTPLTLGETISSSISEPGEQDTFTFSGTPGQRLYFDGLSGNFNIDIRVISPSGQQVLFDDTDDNSQPFSLQETGTYQLIVDGNGDTTGDYSFRLLDLASVTDLTFDTTIEGTLEPGTETDLFKFTGTTGQKLFLEDNGSQSGGSVILYGPGNQFITSVSLSGNREITLPGDGEYILAIEGFSGEQTLNYSFQVVTPETITTPFTLGETISSTISEPGEQDTFTFSGTPGQRLYFDGLSGNFNIDIRVISPSGQQVLFDDTDDNSQPFSLQETGTYQLIVDGNGDTTGDYSFRLLDLASVTDLTFDTTIEGTLEPGTETDLFKFIGTANQTIFIDDLGSQSGGSYILYGPGNQFVDSRSLGFNDEITLPGDGEYILAIQGFSSEQTLNYSFQVVTPDNTTEPLTLGETISSTITEPGEQDTFTFSGTPGQRLYFDGLSGNFNIDIRVISPSGQQLLFDDTDDNSQPFSLQETGTYQLIVDGNGDTTGDYSFRLLDLASVTDLTFDTTIEGTLEPGTETDLFKFIGTANQTLSFEDLGSQSGGSVIIYGPGNQFITSRSLRFDFDVTLPGDGTYILVLEGFSDNTINYRFRVQ
ncbi:MAG: hypothetical protein F6K55_28985, partial [Moorea sp. SIO4A3]|nr:hypothetical protein [Moorena sp. SIO4A3]